jgi:PAB1-binding protein PBP1
MENKYNVNTRKGRNLLYAEYEYLKTEVNKKKPPPTFKSPRKKRQEGTKIEFDLLEIDDFDMPECNIPCLTERTIDDNIELKNKEVNKNTSNKNNKLKKKFMNVRKFCYNSGNINKSLLTICKNKKSKLDENIEQNVKYISKFFNTISTTHSQIK